MAYIDLVRAINRYARILGKRVDSFPETYPEMVALKDELKAKVNAQKRKKKGTQIPFK